MEVYILANTKRKATKPRPHVKGFNVKTIDLTENKLSPPVRELTTRIDKLFRKQVKECNIPAFTVMGKVLTLEAFFLNHTDMEAILGDNVGLLDRMALSAICSAMATDVRAAIEVSSTKYVGIWDTYTLYNVFAATITFMNHDTNPAKYLTALQYKTVNDETLSTLPEGSYMPFTEYNPNRFYQQLMQIRQAGLNVISGIIEKKIPKAFLCSPEMPLSYMMYKRYYNHMHTAISDVVDKLPHDNGFGAQPATERKVRVFAEGFEKPFLELLVNLLEQSGLSTNIINLALGATRVHLLYDDPATKAMDDVNITYCMSTEKAGLPMAHKVEYKTSIGDAVMMGMIDPDRLPKTRCEKYGKAIRGFLLDLVTYAINVYCQVVETNKAADTDAGTASTDSAEDISDKELDSLLGGGTEMEEVP